MLSGLSFRQRMKKHAAGPVRSEQPGWASVSAWFSTAGVLVLLVLCGVSAWLPPAGLEARFSPEAIHLLRAWGLVDVFHSRWFTWLLLSLVLNLFLSAAMRFPGLVATFRGQAPEPLPAFQLFGERRRRPDDRLGIELNTGISRTAFRDQVLKWGAQQRILLQPVVDSGSERELQFAGSTGLGPELGGCLTFFAAAVGLLALWTADLGFGSGEARLESGLTSAPVAVQPAGAPPGPILRGVQARLLSVAERERFRIETVRVARDRVEARFLRAGAPREVVGQGVIRPGFPGAFQGYALSLQELGVGRDLRYRVLVSDTEAEVQQKYPALELNQWMELDAGRFRIVRAQAGEGESLGPSLEMEFRSGKEGAGLSQRFWIFRDHPAYDRVRRAKSRYHFEYEGAEPSLSAIVRVTREPGGSWARWAAVVLVLALLGNFIFPRRRYWFAWKPGKVVCAFSADHLAHLESRWLASLKALKARVLADVPPASVLPLRKGVRSDDL